MVNTVWWWSNLSSKLAVGTCSPLNCDGLYIVPADSPMARYEQLMPHNQHNQLSNQYFDFVVSLPFIFTTIVVYSYSILVQKIFTLRLYNFVVTL